MKVKSIMIFLTGIVCGFGIALSIGFYRMNKDKGTQIIGLKLFGNVEMFPVDMSSAMLPDLSEMLIFRCDGENIASFFLDPNRKLTEFSMYKKGSDETIFRVTRDIDNNWTRLIYGDVGKGETYIDIDCDGNFDLKWIRGDSHGLIRQIYLGGKWQAVSKCNLEEATMQGDQGTVKYIFEEGKGWVIKELEEAKVE